MRKKLFHRSRWETPPRLASETGTSPDTIRNAIKCGELEAHRFGSAKRPSYRVSREAWERYLALKSTFKKLDETAKRTRRCRPLVISTREYV
jgi:hypothetical protein